MEEIFKKIDKIMNASKLDSIALFINRERPSSSAACAVALALAAEARHKAASVVVDDANRINFGHRLIATEPPTEHFLGVAVDCRAAGEAESSWFGKSYAVVDACSQRNAKGFGIASLLGPGEGGTGEALARKICEAGPPDAETATYLYMAVLAETGGFAANAGADGFGLAKALLEAGADGRYARWCALAEPGDVLECQEIMLRNMKTHGHAAYFVIGKDERAGHGTSEFVKAFRRFANTRGIFAWCMFFVVPGGMADAYVRQDAPFAYDISKTTKRYNFAPGSSSARIPSNEIPVFVERMSGDAEKGLLQQQSSAHERAGG